jgi:hypothetical protein
MADVVLTPQVSTKGGITPSYTAIDATDTYYYNNAGTVILHFLNTGSISTVTFDITKTVQAEAITDPTITVPATTGDKMVGPLSDLYEVESGANAGQVKFTQDVASGVTVAVIRTA